MKKIKWGLLSTARINRRVIPAIRDSRRGELIAVASRVTDRARAYAKEWKIESFFGSYAGLLSSAEIDAVYISLPNQLHAEWAVKALEAGKHVLLEKPLALTVSEVDQILSARDKSGCLCMEAFMYRHHPQTNLARQWVVTGKLGEISLVRSAFNFQMADRVARDGTPDYRLTPELGGGCLWDVGVYPLSYAQYLLGSPPILVMGSQWLGPSGIDETFAGQMLYPGGQIAQISASFRTPFQTFMEVIGTKGRLFLTKPFIGLEQDRRMVFTPADGDPVEIPVPDANLYLGEIDNLNAAILDGVPQLIPLEESYDHIKTAVALLKSATTQSVVRL